MDGTMSSPTLSRQQTRVPQHDVRYLTDEEISKFLDDLDHNDDGQIDYAEVERKLDEAHEELVPNPLAHNLNHDSKDDHDRHAFLRSIMGSDARRIPREVFARQVRQWKIPSMKQEAEEEEEQKRYMRSLPKWRRIRSWWTVHGPNVLFLVIVVGMIIAFGVWQLVKYLTTGSYTEAAGAGVVISKTCAGMMYPTWFFLILSMARYFSTFMRRSRIVSKYINWDLSQEFHIYMSIFALLLATIHSVSHLSGSFRVASQPSRQGAVAEVLGEAATPMSYRDYLASRPGYTGIPALVLFYTMALFSMPAVRKRNWEIFQCAHLLMFPLIALLMAHGTAALFQYYLFGYFLAFPILMVLIERCVRVAIGFRRIPATLTILDDQTVEVSATIPSSYLWSYHAGQYIFLQVPAISFWQWHPFTVSTCSGNDMTVHIKAEGSWTKSLREMARGEKSTKIEVGINGPFGAPAQRFYDYTHTILVGSGIGFTPFSGIVNDLQERDNRVHGGPKEPGVALHREKPLSRSSTRSNIVNRSMTNLSRAASRARRSKIPTDYRRCDVHWTVRDRNHLLWFSDLLNSVSLSQTWHHDHDEQTHLDVRIQTHVTQQRKEISHHVYRWLLELHRTEAHPESPLTGLINPTHFGRPDFVKILDAHYEDMVRYMSEAGVDREKLKVGIFYCGAPVVGELLADRARLLTAKGEAEGTFVRYIFHTEVFN